MFLIVSQFHVDLILQNVIRDANFDDCDSFTKFQLLYKICAHNLGCLVVISGPNSFDVSNHKN